ncbi:MAG TPA: hypothetical protein VNJ01_06955 [Bacteriovoracaceae bacterium]|nr:hypothetical protein [Bacteriovoracaceae bacterium]
MKLWSLLLLPMLAFAQVKPESFIIQISDQSMNVLSPPAHRTTFSVIVDNRALTDQVGKFTVLGKNLKFISVKTGQTETIEIENKSSDPVVFVPVSPAFQEVELLFGKKAYEIPSKK